MNPENIKYSTTHEWVKADGDQAIIGITDHAQSELGDVVYVELPQTGAKLHKGSVFGSVESVKTVSDLIAPVNGEVIEINNNLIETPEVLNESPYSDGWLIKVKLDNPDEINELVSSESYESYLQEH
ncbi:MAG: glycine cleavage system protein GcvH [Armatimonadota bacterium]